jgi:fatty acid desaturase
VTPPTRGRDTAVYQRVATVLHVAFLVAFLLTFALVGGVTAPVAALAIGAVVFAAWAVYMLHVEANARRDDAMREQQERRTQIDRSFAAERRAVAPPTAMSSAAGTVVAATPAGPTSNPIRPPAEPTGE